MNSSKDVVPGGLDSPLESVALPTKLTFILAGDLVSMCISAPLGFFPPTPEPCKYSRLLFFCASLMGETLSPELGGRWFMHVTAGKDWC